MCFCKMSLLIKILSLFFCTSLYAYSDNNALEFIASSLFIKGSDASIRGKSIDAAQFFRGAIEIRPHDNYLKIKLAVELIHNNELGEAIKILEILYDESYHKDNAIALILAGAYSSFKKPIRAQQIFKKIINTSANSKEACLIFVKSYTAQNNYSEARDLLLKCEKKTLDEPAYAFYRGKIEYSEDHEALAKLFFKKSLSLDPSYSEAALALGALYERKKETKSALNIYKDFLANDGNSTNIIVLSRLVELFFSIEEKKEVISYAETLSGLDNSNLNLKLQLAVLYSDSKLYENAIMLFQEILKVAPDSEKIIYNLGTLNKQTNNFKEAIKYFKLIPKASSYYKESNREVGQMLKLSTLK